MHERSSSKLLPDDPRVTAFALGELEGDERTRVAAAVAADPALQSAVDEIHAAAAQLTAALASEPAPEVEPIELPAPERQPVRLRRPIVPTVRTRLFQFPYVAVGTLAAACFAIVFILLNQPTPTAPVATAVSPVDADNNAAEPADSPATPPATATAVTLAAPGETPGAAPVEPAVVAQAEPTTPAPAPILDRVPEPDDTLLTPLPANLPPMIAEAGDAAPAPAVRATPATPPQVAGGPAHSIPGRAATGTTPAPGARSARSAPDTMLADTAPAVPASDVLPPAATDANPSTGYAFARADDAGLYSDFLAGGDASSGDRVRTTFRDFGSRYRGNRPQADAVPAEGTRVIASNGGAAEGASSLVALPEERRRLSEENIKTTAPVRPRIPMAEPMTGSTAQAEVDLRGSIDSGGRVADLETQLRELQPADASLDSPVQDFVRDNAFVAVADNPATVFPIAVDGASHVNVRRALLAGTRPARDTVRIEELLNYHAFAYAAPAADATAPFAAALEVTAAPWAPQHRLVRVGLRARDLAAADRPAAHLVLLVETGDPGTAGARLPLIQETLRQLVDRLQPADEVALVVHSSTASLLLPSTAVRDRAAVFAAINQIRSTGAASGTTGLRLAYDIARAHWIDGGVNRVIFASDGDTRIGEAGRAAALHLIGTQAADGIALTALGYGVHDIRDSMLEHIAHQGTGTVACVDTMRDVHQALLDRAGAGFATVARNVKLQVEFNPAQVQSWRLIGYEDRVFLREDFDSESLAAANLGAGHTTTALFEIVPAVRPAPSVDDTVAVDAEMLTVKVRYALPADDAARVVEFSLTDAGRSFAAASADFKFAAAVAGFGMILRESPHRGSATLADVTTWARAGLGADPSGRRAEFLDLVEQARSVVR